MSAKFDSSDGNTPAQPIAPGATAESRYRTLHTRRDPFLRRARKYATITIPSILPPIGTTQHTDLVEPYQGFGARLVTSLASRLMTAFLPPGQSFFQLRVKAEVLLGNEQDEESVEQQQFLTKYEQAINREIESAKWRAPTYLALQHLIVTGNVMEQTMPDNTIKVFRLDQYVVSRDPQGNVMEMIIQENLPPQGLPPVLAAMAGANDVTAGNLLPLYTWVRLAPRKGAATEFVWEIHQEFQGREVPGSRGVFDTNPFRALRWMAVIGEDYGRGKVEEHFGDLRSIDGLQQSLVEGSAMASRNITMIRPNAAGGLNLRRRLTKADNGEYVIGNPEDVEMLQFTNNNGLKTAAESIALLKQELGAAFLTNSSVQRKGERVTAFELRKLIEEIEQVLGGVFSSLQSEIQEGRITRLIFQMQDQEKLPDWSDPDDGQDIVEPAILTGIEALGRERDVERGGTFLQFVAQLTPEEREAIKMTDLLTKVANGVGLPGIVRSQAEVDERREQRLQQEAALGAIQQGAGQVIADSATQQEV
jgi:hypothetical protein